MLSLPLCLQLYYQLDIDDYIYAWWADISTPAAVKSTSIWLQKYRLNSSAQIDGVTDNLSGITYNPETNSLWVIVNNPQQILELNTDFSVQRKITLTNFQDTEALAYAGGNKLIIADERDQSIVVAKITPDSQSIDKHKLRRVTLNTNGGTNKGFEGIAVNPDKETIYVVKERDPMKLLTVKGFLNSKPRLIIANSPQIEADQLFLQDLSGLHFDQTSGNLLFLSDESQALAEVTQSGEKISFLDLISGFHGLKQNIPQAEGVTMGANRDIYLVSEPNLIYKFTATP